MPRSVAILIHDDGRGMIVFDLPKAQSSEDMIPWAKKLIAQGEIGSPSLWMFASFTDSMVGAGFRLIRIEERQGALRAVATGDTARMPRLTSWPPR